MHKPAGERRNEAARRFYEMTDQVPTGIPHPDNVDRIKAVSHEYSNVSSP